MSTVRVEVEGDRKVSRRLGGLGDRIGDSTTLMDRLAKDFFDVSRGRFEKQGSGMWAPDLPATRAAKLRSGHDPRTLHRTNALARSLSAPHAPGSVVRVDRNGLTVGTSVHEAQFAQNGRGSERRRPVIVTRAHLKRWVETLGDWLVEQE